MLKPILAAAALLLSGCADLPFMRDMQGGGGTAATQPSSAPPSSSAPSARPGAAAPASDAAFVQSGDASYFTLEGARTASGAPTDPDALTAAHDRLPLGSVARVTNTSNGRSVQVRIVDRGPERQDRIIDLSRAAAERLGMVETGVAPVRVEAFLGDQQDQRVRRDLAALSGTAR
jgi:rare lipoprotein A